jgi:hypothetical protein
MARVVNDPFPALLWAGYMNNTTPTLEEFRKILATEFSKKGVKPPIPAGKKEQLLYQQWLKGKERCYKN